MPKRKRTWHGFWARIVASACLSAGLIIAGRPGAPAGADNVPTLAEVLARFARASSDPGAPPLAHVETWGTLASSGLTGSFHTWRDGDRERSDGRLGPRTERTLRVGDRTWYGGPDGEVWEYTGLVARRLRTERFIDSGDFANVPQRCVLRGRALVDGQATFAVDVTAEGGETETLYLDAATGLPDRIAYDDDDARTTIDLLDWRTVAGRRYAFKSISSDGDHPYDTVQITSAVDVAPAFAPSVFQPLVPRYIELAGPQTVPLEQHDGHFYAPVRIGGRSLRFLVDTGAQDIVIDKRIAGELGLPAVGSLQASGAGRTGGLQLTTLDALDVGSGRLRDIVATTIDLGASTEGAFHIDGILGNPFFAAATVRLDFARGTMTFGAPGSFAAVGQPIPLVLDRGYPEATLRMNARVDGTFIIDTGSGAEVLLYKPFVDKHAGIVPFTMSVRRSYGIGGSTESYRSSLDALQLGSVSLYHADADVMRATRGAFADRFDAGNVGLGVLKNFAVTFDEARNTMYLEQGQDFDDGRRRV